VLLCLDLYNECRLVYDRQEYGQSDRVHGGAVFDVGVAVTRSAARHRRGGGRSRNEGAEGWKGGKGNERKGREGRKETPCVCVNVP